MNITLWIVQGLLAFAFIFAGAMKLLAYDKYKTKSEKKNRPSGITRPLAAFIGIAEIAGSLGIILPMATQHRSLAQPVGRSRTRNHHAAGDWLSRASP
jgi:uncharacterized membrane protein YphA (DoxX/SURF4 family)